MSFNIFCSPSECSYPQAVYKFAMQLLIGRKLRWERLHDGAGNEGGPILRCVIMKPRVPAACRQSSCIGRLHAVISKGGDTGVLVAVLHTRLSRPGRHG